MLNLFLQSIKHKTLEFDYFCFSGLSKIMILNGNDVKKSVEIVSLDSTSTSCDPFDDYPLAVRGTVGTVLDGQTAIVCGGQKPPTKSCYTYGLNAWRPGASYYKTNPIGFSECSGVPKISSGCEITDVIKLYLRISPEKYSEFL
jgi:hypothetical protein